MNDYNDQQLYYLGEEDSELGRAWSLLANPVARDHTGEVWEYMGSLETALGGWHHCFRHRHHPLTQRREYVQVRASEGWLPLETVVEGATDG